VPRKEFTRMELNMARPCKNNNTFKKEAFRNF
jgi:hypothetical protein